MLGAKNGSVGYGNLYAVALCTNPQDEHFLKKKLVRRKGLLVVTHDTINVCEVS